MKVRIVLLPEEKLTNLAKSYSERISKEIPTKFTLDETHIPHVTLVSPEIEDKDYDKIVELVRKIAAETQRVEILINEVRDDETTFIGLYFDDDQEVVNLREKIIKSVSGFNKGELKIRDPHVTLTRAESESSMPIANRIANQFPMGHYYLDSIAIGEDAENGTCKRILIRFNLR